MLAACVGVLSRSVLSDSLRPHGAVSRQASLQFSRQEYWRGCHFLLQKILRDPGIEPASLASPAVAGGFLTISTTWEARVVGAGVVRRGRRTSPDGKGFTELESRYFVFFVCLLLFLMWIIFKVFTEFVTSCFWFFLFLLLLFYGFGVFLVGGALAAGRHMGSHLPHQGSNLHSLHWKAKSQPLDHQGSPRDVCF